MTSLAALDAPQERKQNSKGSLWQAVRERGIAFFLMALAIVACAGVPLATNTARAAAEYRVTALQKEILYLQQDKARLSRELFDRMTLKVLEQAGKNAGLAPPVRVEYVPASQRPVQPSSTTTP